MKKQGIFIRVAALVMFCLLPKINAHADILCFKKSVAVKNEKVNLSTLFKVNPGIGCPRGYLPLLNTNIFKGDKGDTGAAGPKGDPGMLNLASCIPEVTVGSVCLEGNVCETQLACGAGNGSQQNDLMLNYAFDLSNDSAYITRKTLLYVTGNNYPSGIRIRTTSEEGWGSHVPSLAIICCLPG